MRTSAANPLKNERVGIGTGNPVNFDRVDDEGKGGRRIDDPRWDALAKGVDPEDKGGSKLRHPPTDAEGKGTSVSVTPSAGCAVKAR